MSSSGIGHDRPSGDGAADLMVHQYQDSSGFTHLSPGKRAKSRSAV